MSRNRFMMFGVLLALVLGTVTTAFAQAPVLQIWADETRAPVLQELATDLEAEFGIELDVVQLDFGSIRDQLLVAGPVGEGPDILIGAPDWVGQFVLNGAVVPLELGDKAELFNPEALELFSFDGELYALPYALENIALIRNVDLVPEAPTTWEEVREIGLQLQESGAAEYAIALQTGDVYHNYPVLSAFGGYIFGDDGSGGLNPADIGFNSEGSIAAAEWLSGLYADGLAPTDVDTEVALQLWEDGDAAMLMTGPWNSLRIPETAEAGGFEFAVDPIPGSEIGLERGLPFRGGQGFYISAFSDNQLLAEIFLLELVATPEFMQAVYDADPRTAVFEGVDTSTNPLSADFTAAGEGAPSIPAIPEMNAVWAAGASALTLVSQGEDPVASFETAAEQIIEAIDLQNSDERIVGLGADLQDEAGCDSDWMPACELTFFENQGDGIYTLTVTLPAGEYEYKVAMNGTWDENYGVDGERDGDNIPLALAEETEVTFTYDDNTNIVVDSVNNPAS